jgi:hypothetical protein
LNCPALGFVGDLPQLVIRVSASELDICQKQIAGRAPAIHLQKWWKIFAEFKHLSLLSARFCGVMGITPGE